MYGDRNTAGLALAARFVSSGSRVLEVGSGPGYLSRELQDMDYDVVSCDLVLRMASKTRIRMNRDSVVVADVHSLPFQPEAFDAIVLIGVISYVTDPVDVLCKLRNLLKPDGILLISSANTNLFFISISRKIDQLLVRLGFRYPKRKTAKSFFSKTCTYYKASEFNALVSETGFSLLDSANIGFGRLKLRKKSIFPDWLDVGLARLLSSISRLRMFRWLGNYAFANVACFRNNACEPDADALRRR